jgi:hypothetical protein
MNRKGMEMALAKTNHPMDVENIESSKIGRRPILSEIAPSNGALRNAQSEKTEKRTVIVSAEAPNSVR